MRAFFVTQGSSLEVFHNLERRLGQLVDLDDSSWFVADRDFHAAYVAENGRLSGSGHVLAEWELVARGLANPAWADEAGHWEGALGVPTLWPAAIADRRIHNGPLVKVVQDYRSPYSDEAMAAILVSLARAFSESFSSRRPDVVFCFGPNTAAAIIAGWTARVHGIPFLTLKSTKVSNLVSLSEEWVDHHPHIETLYRQFRAGQPIPAASDAFAQAYLEAARHGVSYEGIKIAKTEGKLAAWRAFLRAAPRALLRDLSHRMARRPDPQRQPQLATAWHLGPAKVARMRRSVAALGARLVSPEQLKGQRYVFFPLNSEPEIAVSVYCPFHRNQIEVARSLAESLPVGMKLVVKDHPRSWGQRSPGYYRRLAEIPNVLVVPTEVPAAQVIADSAAVAVMSSFVGFEALLQGRPVVVLGTCMYDFLPAPMVSQVKVLDDLPTIMKTALAADVPDKDLLRVFVAAVHAGSAAVDLYSRMLRKGGRTAGTGAISTNLDSQYQQLAAYALARYTAATTPHAPTQFVG